MVEIIVKESDWNQVKNHLLKDSCEHLAFLQTKTYTVDDDLVYLVQGVTLVSDKDFRPEGWSMQLSLEGILEITNSVRKKKMGLIEAHSHPLSSDDVGFSITDVEGFKEFVPYVLESLHNKPYAALVLGKNSVDGLSWKSNHGERVDKITIPGNNLTTLQTTSSKLKTNFVDYAKFDRQIPVLTEEGQKRLANIKVAIVGAGGLGSHIIQQLAHLGITDFTIIEYDKITKNNLNRLVGASPSDISKSKISNAERMIRSICGKGVRIKTVETNVREKEALVALKRADFIFSCVDNDGARMILNEFSKAYMKPCIDCAVGINLENNKISEIGGRVVFVRPGKPCLMCLNEIDLNEVGYFLRPKKEHEIERKVGYIQNYDVPAPSVITLNGVIASAATTEFLAFVTGFRSAKDYLSYDAMEQKLVERKISSDSNCFICSSIEGKGNDAQIEERYSVKNYQKQNESGFVEKNNG